MKLLACAAALLCAAVAVAAAPALSTTPYRPKAVDFELSAPPATVAAARGGRVVSRVLRPGRRFNLVGMRWRGRAEPRQALDAVDEDRRRGRPRPRPGHRRGPAGRHGLRPRLGG